MTSRPTRVALIATADVGNFGDMLFPDLAERALTRRLGDIELTVYGFRRMGGEDWPRPVVALSTLASSLDETDLLVIGGGDLIRFAAPLAPGYGPTEPGVHNPTALWLAPTLLAAAHGVPVVWSAVGAHGDRPEWVRLPGRAAVEATTLATVRDGESVEALRQLAPDAKPRIVPDTAFGVMDLITDTESGPMREWRAAAGVDGRYAIVQTAPQLRDFATEVRAFADAVRKQGLAVIELPISPSLGDTPAALEDLGPATSMPVWPPPVLLAEIIGRAEAVAAQSLHLSIVAIACGVPVHRPPPAAGDKYEIVVGLPGVHLWNAGSVVGPIGREAPSVAARELAGQVAGYWDDVAALVRRGPRAVPAALDALLTTLPFELEALRAATGELERRRDELDEEAARLYERIHALEQAPGRQLLSRAYNEVRSTFSRGAG